MLHNTQSTVGQIAGRVLFALVGKNCKMQNANCKLQNGIAASHSPVTSHKSPRSGISLTEVLIAMGILTVGLLGVASIFPVASFYMQKGDVADRGSAIAQAAFNELLARGLLNPQQWLMWEDGQIKPDTTNITPSSSFTRRFADKLQQQLARVNGDVNLNATQRQWNVATEFGAAFVIDPMGVASVSWSKPVNLGTKFPATMFRLDSTASYYSSWWQPWYYSTGGGPEVQLAWPVRRLTLPQGPLTPMNMVVADKLFSSSDDLTMEVPTSDKPSRQNLQLANLDGGTVADDPLSRQSRGEFSWIATVSPSTSYARNALAADPSAFTYEISVAVFHKRIVGRVPPQSDEDFNSNLDLMMQNERLVRAKVVSSGLSGGELLLEAVEPGTPTEKSPFANLKVGNWYMLVGPHPNSASVRPMFVARWYRVLSIEGKDRRLNAQGTYDPAPSATEPERRLVSLRGPQWPWQPQSNAADLSNNLCFSVIANVVAVHSKTLQLEGNSAWSVQ